MNFRDGMLISAPTINSKIGQKNGPSFEGPALFNEKSRLNCLGKILVV